MVSAHVVLFAYIISAILGTVIGVYVLKNSYRRHPTQALGVYLLIIAVWSATNAGHLVASTPEWTVLFRQLTYLGSTLLPIAGLVFTLLYVGREPLVTGKSVGALLVVPVLTIGIVLTNGFHGLHWTSVGFTTVDGFTIATVTVGPWFWVHFVYAYFVMLVGLGLLIAFSLMSTYLYRLQAILILLSFLLPISVNMLYNVELLLLPTDPTPIGFLVTGIPLAAIVLRTDLGTFIPVAHERVVRTLEDPVIVVDGNNRIIDANPAAVELFDADGGSLLGHHTADVLPDSLLDGDSLTDTLDDSIECTIERDGEQHWYMARRWTTNPGSDVSHYGWIVTLTDITVQHRQQEALESTTEDLELLNRIVDHDIRNDMAIIDGWAGLLREQVDEDGAEAIDRIVDATENVNSLTEDVRALMNAMLDEDDDLAETQLNVIFEAQIREIRDIYEGVSVQVDGSIPSVTVLANDMLNSVFRNVLSNAVIHNDGDDPGIVVTAEQSREVVRIEIADNGPGVPDDRKEEVFGKGNKGLESPGTGLGLYLVNTLVEQYDGRIWIEDNDPNGSVFVLELPVVADPTGSSDWIDTDDVAERNNQPESAVDTPVTDR